MKFLVLNGPNLNLLGKREPEIYGTRTLQDINTRLDLVAVELKVRLVHFQSNSESELIDKIHDAFEANIDDKLESFNGVIINPAAFTHTSIALRDAISALKLPFIEVHLSNVHAREAFRHHSYFSDLAEAVIAGLGEKGYEYALRTLVSKISNHWLR